MSHELGADIEGDSPVRIQDLLGCHRDQAIAVLLVALPGSLRRNCGENAVPDKELKNFYSQLKNDVNKGGLDYVIYGHFGNSHIHLNMLAKNAEEFEKAKNLYNRMCLSAIKLRGTFAAEHGVGKNKKALLYEMYDEHVMNEMFRIKQTVDPNLILCGGNIFKTES